MWLVFRRLAATDGLRLAVAFRTPLGYRYALLQRHKVQNRFTHGYTLRRGFDGTFRSYDIILKMLA